MTVAFSQRSLGICMGRGPKTLHKTQLCEERDCPVLFEAMSRNQSYLLGEIDQFACASATGPRYTPCWVRNFKILVTTIDRIDRRSLATTTCFLKITVQCSLRLWMGVTIKLIGTGNVSILSALSLAYKLLSEDSISSLTIVHAIFVWHAAYRDTGCRAQWLQSLLLRTWLQCSWIAVPSD